MDTEQGELWRFDGFVFSPAASELSRDGKPVAIEPQSLRLLEYLIRNRRRVVSRADLVDALWSGRAVSDWAVAAAIKSLRASLGDTGPHKTILRTVHSRGFRFVAPVTTEDATAAAYPTQTTVPRVFVRCFRALTSGEETAFLADGLTEDLITDLSRHPALGVLSPNAARAIGDAAPPAELAVARIVEGSLRRLNEMIRITVAVLDADGLTQVWAERFDLTPDTLLAGQDRISARLAAVLAPGSDPAGAHARGTRISEAYETYLKGRYAYFRYTPDAFAEALAHFETAARLDPRFSDAFAQQAYCRTTLHVFGLPGADATLAPAEALASKAIALDDSAALGHARLGWVLGYLDRPDEAIAAFEAALTHDPHNAEVYLAYGETMNRLARPERAAPLLDSAFARDMFFPPSWEFARGHTCALLNDLDAAIGHFRAVLARVDRFIPARVQLARALAESGDHAGAEAEVARIRRFAPKYSLAHATRMFPYPDARQRARLLDGLAGAGLS